MNSRSSRGQVRGSAPLEGPQLQVAPMLDMAFQLLAFFILTFESPTAETRIDLYLPSAPVALPGGSANQANPLPRVNPASDLQIDDRWTVVARSDSFGELSSLMLKSELVGEIELKTADDLRERLLAYRSKIGPDEPLKIALKADDGLRYELAARLLEACSQAGAGSVQLLDPSSRSDSVKP